jgi:hypothetical protein
MVDASSTPLPLRSPFDTAFATVREGHFGEYGFWATFFNSLF